MKKYLLLLLALLVLAACGTSESPADATPQTEATAVTNDTPDEPTESPQEPTDAPQEPTTESVPVVDTGEFAFSSTVEEASIVRAEDHYLGSDDPAVTIIEYGDFQ